jgi:hypothetical protein
VGEVCATVLGLFKSVPAEKVDIGGLSGFGGVS